MADIVKDNPRLAAQAKRVLANCDWYDENGKWRNDGIPSEDLVIATMLHFLVDATADTPSPDQLGRHLWQHIERAMKTLGKVPPEHHMSYIEEQLTGEEYNKIYTFLSWLYRNDLTIGHGNYEQRYAEFREATR